MSTAKNAILKAKIEGVIYEILVKTNASNVYVDDTTTLAAKLSDMIADIATKATTTELTEGLATKAALSHTHAQADVTGLEAALTARPTTDAMNTAISTAISNLVNGAPETADTLKELSDLIAENSEAMDLLNAAIGGKADNTAFLAVKATVDALGTLASKSVVSESDLDTELAAKVNAAAEGNHSHANKALLDTYTQTEANLADAVAKKHEHANKTVLDGITSAKVTAWDGKARVLYSATEPADLTENDLWVQLV